jgi:hypothetical protein
VIGTTIIIPHQHHETTTAFIASSTQAPATKQLEQYSLHTTVPAAFGNMLPPPHASLDEENVQQAQQQQLHHQYPNSNSQYPNHNDVLVETSPPTSFGKSNGTVVATTLSDGTVLRRTWPQSTFRRAGPHHHQHRTSLPVIVEPSAGSMHMLDNQTSSRSWNSAAVVMTAAAPIVDASSDHHNTVEPIVAAMTADKSATRVVSYMRLLVLAVLLTSMASTATIVYLYTSREETSHFKQSFTDDTNHVVEALSETLYTTMGAVDSYIVSLMSLCKSTHQSWPFVSVPDAAVRLSKLRSLSKGVFVQQAHIVAESQRLAWEKYTANHNAWVNESLVLQTTDPNYYGVDYNATSVHNYNVIVGHEGPSTGDGPFLPTWHSSPYVPGTEMSLQGPCTSVSFVALDSMIVLLCWLYRYIRIQF